MPGMSLSAKNQALHNKENHLVFSSTLRLPDFVVPGWTPRGSLSPVVFVSVGPSLRRASTVWRVTFVRLLLEGLAVLLSSTSPTSFVSATRVCSKVQGSKWSRFLV